MRELVAQYLSKSISRRGFVNRLAKTGVSLAAAQSVVQSLTPLVYGKRGIPMCRRRISGFSKAREEKPLLSS